MNSHSCVLFFLEVIEKYRQRIAKLEKSIDEVLRLEKEEKEMKTAENTMSKVHKFREIFSCMCVTFFAIFRLKES